jgi:riboflavin kinase/FMN adenylyltransferase
VTFDPHPAKVLRPSAAPHLLTATKHKIALIRELGVAHLLVLQFDREFANTTPEEFVRQLVAHASPLREICVGHEWSFGKNRAGNLNVLRELGGRLAFDVVGIPPVPVDGQTVSSTAIRRAVELGDFATAAKMLGRDYTILGTVKQGAQLGKKLGFPTANLSAHSEQFPPDGVYVVEARVGSGLHSGVANLGHRPSIDASTRDRILEIHLLDFNGDLYGSDMEVRFLHYLRPERKFESLEALAEQIRDDVQEARAYLQLTR